MILIGACVVGNGKKLQFESLLASVSRFLLVILFIFALFSIFWPLLRRQISNLGYSLCCL